LKNTSEDEIALKNRVAAEIAIVSESLSKITEGSSESEDLNWRANAHTELAIGILKLLLDEKVQGYRRVRERASPVLGKISASAKYERIHDLLNNAAVDLRGGKLEKCLADLRNARDMLTSILAGERKKDLKRKREVP
jgi:hypothetical protein